MLHGLLTPKDGRPPGLSSLLLPLVVAVSVRRVAHSGPADGRDSQKHVRDLDTGLGAEDAAVTAGLRRQGRQRGRGLVAGRQEHPDRVLDVLKLLGAVVLTHLQSAELCLTPAGIALASMYTTHPVSALRTALMVEEEVVVDIV